MKQQNTPAHSNNTTANTLTVATFNTWFGRFYARERCQAMLQILRRYQPHVIGLQEVTPRLLPIILEQDWIRDGYECSDVNGGTLFPYGVLLLWRIPHQAVTFHKLLTVMHRKLLVVEFLVNGQTIKVATVHLESMKHSAFFRRHQLKRIFPLLQDSDHAILMGDFNFCATWESENNHIDNQYQDLWTVLRRHEPGYTIDTDKNRMRFQIKKKHKSVRFDRILLRSHQARWQPKSIELLGTEPISPSLPDVFPSDHFGLVARLEWNPTL